VACAILKAADLRAEEPERATRMLVDGGFAPRCDYALQTLNEVPYYKRREHHAAVRPALRRTAPARRTAQAS
jgi:NitT/TauT family transport system substrate-binding protein